MHEWSVIEYLQHLRRALAADVAALEELRAKMAARDEQLEEIVEHFSLSVESSAGTSTAGTRL